MLLQTFSYNLFVTKFLLQFFFYKMVLIKFVLQLFCYKIFVTIFIVKFFFYKIVLQHLLQNFVTKICYNIFPREVPWIIKLSLK